MLQYKQRHARLRDVYYQKLIDFYNRIFVPTLNNHGGFADTVASSNHGLYHPVCIAFLGEAGEKLLFDMLDWFAYYVYEDNQTQLSAEQRRAYQDQISLLFKILLRVPRTFNRASERLERLSIEDQLPILSSLTNGIILEGRVPSEFRLPYCNFEGVDPVSQRLRIIGGFNQAIAQQFYTNNREARRNRPLLSWNELERLVDTSLTGLPLEWRIAIIDWLLIHQLDPERSPLIGHPAEAQELFSGYTQWVDREQPRLELDEFGRHAVAATIAREIGAHGALVHQNRIAAYLQNHRISFAP